ncbi:MAG TPA: DUF5916 domain-containing protein [Acidobacteriota bacterium]|nr:DUF5916 domain-containing protein [Acidobacteriota bacterium]
MFIILPLYMARFKQPALSALCILLAAALGNCWLKGEDRLPSPTELTLQVHFIEEEITLDGHLNEEVWKTAPFATGFWQLTPLDRAPATERTEVRVLQDDKYLYFGIMLYDSDPEGIVALDMRRDAGLGNDDFVGLYLDTYHDHRNFYYFSTNPLGTRRDGIVTDARFYNTSWDGIWECRSVVTAEGWSTEIKIPFSTLRFGGELPMTWGFNVSRSIRRKQERAFWAPIPRELGRPGTWRGELFGHLSGIQSDASPSKWEIEPYALVGTSRHFQTNSSDSRWDWGGDVHYHFTPNLRADLSFNTDFAQVEADQEVVNLTRFPLFFPEKREFFLDNAGLFNVGYSEELMMFYSRRIGLTEGRPTPLAASGKVSGRVGPYSLGFLSVQTDATQLVDSGTPVETEPSTNYSVLRVKRDLLTNSSMGAILTSKQQTDGNYQRLVGVDGNLWFTPYLKGELLVAGTLHNDRSRNDIAATGRLLYSKSDISAELTHYSLGPDFNPEVGFVQENNLRHTMGAVSYTRWLNSRGIRAIIWNASTAYDTLYEGEFYGRVATLGVDFDLQSGDLFRYLYSQEDRRLYESVSIGPARIGGGDYQNPSHLFQVETNPSRTFSFIGTYRQMDYWTGERRENSFAGSFRPVAPLAVDLIYSYNQVDHPSARFEAHTLSNRILYAFSTDLFVKSFIQWNNLDNRLSTNLLFSYQYRPGSDLYIVYNEIQNRFNDQGFEPTDRVLMVKLTFNLRF